MLSSFDLEKLQILLRDFYTLTRIRITVFNDSFEELVSYPEELAEVCCIIRKDPVAMLNCHDCDRKACETAYGRHDTYIYQCHSGLTEAITPIYLENTVVGYLMFGHLFSFDSRKMGVSQVIKRCTHYQINSKQLEACLNQMPLLAEDYILSASHLLLAVASYLCMERMTFLKENDLPVRLDQYINGHLPEQITVQRLCDEFQIGKTLLYAIAKQSYGCGIAEHIRMMRIRMAKDLLINHLDLTIAQIADRCGFQDYNYFITVFKHETGTTPRRFRQGSDPKQ